MARPSKHTDLELIRVGRKMISKHGVTGLSLRQVAAEAQVNLGMFSYHFGSKKEFIRRVLQDEYEKLFSLLDQEFQASSPGRSPLERLRRILITLGQFACKNREFLAAILKDLLSGEKQVLEFLQKNAPRHLKILFAVVSEAQKAGHLRKDIPTEQIVMSCGVNIAVPFVLGTAIEASQPKALNGALRDMIFSEEFIQMKVDFIIKGFKP